MELQIVMSAKSDTALKNVEHEGRILPWDLSLQVRRRSEGWTQDSMPGFWAEICTPHKHTEFHSSPRRH